MKIYIARRTQGNPEVFVDGEPLEIKPSQKLYNHSDAFEWNYSGSGPSQLALAIMLDLYGPDVALRYYQKFKWAFISNADYDGFVILSTNVETWLNKLISEGRNQDYGDDL